MTEKLTIPPMRPIPTERRQQVRRALVVDYRRTLEQPHPRRERRRILLIAVALVSAAILGAGAYAGYVLTRPTQQLTIGCYNRDSLDADTAVVAADGRAPAAICASVWASAFRDRPQPSQLTACVLATGPVGVFPGDSDVCGRLGLAPYRPDTATQAQVRGLAATKDALVAAFAGSCLNEKKGREAARQLLDRHGFRDWRIEVSQPFTSARPCASLAFDEPHKTLILVPMPRG